MLDGIDRVVEVEFGGVDGALRGRGVLVLQVVAVALDEEGALVVEVVAVELALGGLKFSAVVGEILVLGIVVNEHGRVVGHELGQIDVIARVADHGLKGYKDIAAVGRLR